MHLNSWLFIASISAVSTSILIKEYTVTNDNTYIYLTILAYLILMISYINIFQNNELSSTYTVLQIIQILLIIMFGYVFLNEKLNSKKIIGYISGLICIYLLNETK